MRGRGPKPIVHRCPARGCEELIPRAHCLCAKDFALLPGWLRARLSETKNYGIAWKCHPTQEYLDARSQAIAFVNTQRERAEQRAAAQLPLIPA